MLVIVCFLLPLFYWILTLCGSDITEEKKSPILKALRLVVVFFFLYLIELQNIFYARSCTEKNNISVSCPPCALIVCASLIDGDWELLLTALMLCASQILLSFITVLCSICIESWHLICIVYSFPLPEKCYNSCHEQSHLPTFCLDVYDFLKIDNSFLEVVELKTFIPFCLVFPFSPPRNWPCGPAQGQFPF